MIVKCEKCQTAFKINEELIKPAGTKLRCSKCQHVFRIYRPEPEKPLEAPKITDLRHEIELPSTTPSSVESEERTLEPQNVPIKQKETQKPEPEQEQEPKDIEFETSSVKTEGLKKYWPFKKKQQAENSDKKKSEYQFSWIRPKTFRGRLMNFAALLLGFICLIVIPIESYRPIQELHKLIANAKSFISGLSTIIDPDDLVRMNEFALKTISNDSIRYDKNRDYYYLAFNMLLIEGDILSEKEILLKNIDAEVFEKFGGRENFDYEKLKEARQYWVNRFVLDKGSFRIFKKYKKLLIQAMENASAAGFGENINLMIMLDTGRKQDFFKKHIAFVLDGYHWESDSSYSGEPYEIQNNEFWRKNALEDTPGYGNNPIFDPSKYYLPRFDEDEYGAWFSVWLTLKSDKNYNVINIDFDASAVKKTLLMVVEIILLVIAVLLFISYFIANKVSTAVTRPITELTKGAEKVSKGNYDYEVPVISEDEIGLFTRQFNIMTNGQKERLNLMETLEKFLSRELAEKAATSGLVLGGQKAKCTVMFTDFGGFSTITQKMEAADAVEALNAYFEGLIPIIKKYGGFPDKYIGDAIVAMFGAPVPLEDHAKRAVTCAIEMQWKMREINIERGRKGLTVFEMRIGLNSGDVIVGAIGCDQKLEYTSIGETTNLANRMESQCAIGHVMIAEGTYQLIKNIFFKGVHIGVDPEKVQVKGYPEPVSAYRIYVDNREISKDMAVKDMRNFYIYKDVDHKLKYSPKDIPSVKFESHANFL